MSIHGSTSVCEVKAFYAWTFLETHLIQEMVQTAISVNDPSIDLETSGETRILAVFVCLLAFFFSFLFLPFRHPSAPQLDAASVANPVRALRLCVSRLRISCPATAALPDDETEADCGCDYILLSPLSSPAFCLTAFLMASRGSILKSLLVFGSPLLVLSKTSKLKAAAGTAR